MPLTTGEAISAVLRYYAAAGGAGAGAQWSTDAELRAKAEFMLNELAAEAWTWAPWYFKLGDSTVAVTSGLGYSAALPSNFSSFGTQGQVIISGQTLPLTYMPPDELLVRQQDSTRVALPSYYTLHNSVIYLYPINSAALTLLLKSYSTKTPDMVDCPVAPTIALSTTGAVTDGAHKVIVTFEQALDYSAGTEGVFESNSVTVASTNDNIIVSGIPVSTSRSVVARGLWMTKATNANTFYLFGGIPDNITTTDNIATDQPSFTGDASLITALRTPANAVTGMERFPSDFHYSVMFEGLKAKWMGALGDMREGEFWQRWYQNVRRMWADQQQGQNMLRAFPVYGAASNRGRSYRDRMRSI